jgi:hypothetical protein
VRRVDPVVGPVEEKLPPMVNSERDIFFFLGLVLTASLRLGKLCDSAALAASSSSASALSASAAQAPAPPQGLDMFDG